MPSAISDYITLTGRKNCITKIHVKTFIHSSYFMTSWHILVRNRKWNKNNSWNSIHHSLYLNEVNKQHFSFSYFCCPLTLPLLYYSPIIHDFLHRISGSKKRFDLALNFELFKKCILVSFDSMLHKARKWLLVIKD